MTKKSAKKKTATKKTVKKKTATKKTVNTGRRERSSKKKTVTKKTANTGRGERSPKKKAVTKKTANTGRGERSSKKKTIAKKKITKKVDKKKAVAKKFDPIKQPQTYEPIEEQENVEQSTFHKKAKGEIKAAITDDIKNSKGEVSLDDLYQQIKHIDFFISKSDECLERGCDNPATTWGYCRLHYIGNWSEIKKKQALLGKGRLQSYVMGLIEKYPPKYIKNILSDLSEEKSFFNTLKELGIEEVDDFDDIVDEEPDDEQDIAYETKVTVKPAVEE